MAATPCSVLEMTYAIIQRGDSRSFATGDTLLIGSIDSAEASINIHRDMRPEIDANRAAVLVKLSIECLGEYIDDTNEVVTNVLGFGRYQNGSKPSDGAFAATRAVFEASGLTVVVCIQETGCILDRLLRPKDNAALRFLDEELATAPDIDATYQLDLGYPDGPIERVLRGGLAHRYDITRAQFETNGTQTYAPASRALSAARRRTP
jgi:3-hydroxybutyryl-CoA dehydrogenase